MRIVIAGSSGFLGTHLVKRLGADGHTVVRLVRRLPQADDEVRWDPAAGEVDRAVIESAHAVVNLAGAGAGDRRWTPRYKELLRSSRVDTTSTLARAIAAVPGPSRPAVLVNASGVHWYGDTGDRATDEDSPAGGGFMADLCRVWEAATRPAEEAGTRVVRLRTGLVLHRSGGIFKQMLLPFRFGVGGRLGNGRQYMPVISLADWVDAVVFLVNRPDVEGPVNMVGPAPVTNRRFTKELGAELRRPAVIPVPALALRIVIGEFANDALMSIRAVPKTLSRAGFQFQHPDARSVVHSALMD
jgi:uncharacterized protein